MDRQLIYNMHSAHAVQIDGQTLMPANYFVPHQNILALLKAQVAERPEDIFITFYTASGESTSLTYLEFSKRVFQVSNFLLSKELIEQDRVATVAHNHLDTVIEYFGAWCAGMTAVPINTGESAERIKFIMQDSGVKLAFVQEPYLEMIEALDLDMMIIPASLFETVISEHSDEFSVNHIIDTRSKSAVNYDRRSSFADLETEALIVYTSGTTGVPKGVVLTHYNLMVDAESISKWHGLKSGEAMMCVLPIHHVNGTVVTLLTPLYYGGRVVLNQKFSTENFFERLAQEKIKIVSVVPTLLQFLNHAAIDISKYDLSTFSHFICGAGPLTVELAAKFEDTYGLKIIHGYGLSETTCYSSFLPIDLSSEDHQKWLREFGFPSIGVPISTNEMQIWNNRNEKVREGWRGEIVIRGHNVMKGYYKNHDANLKAFEKGWFHSGDEGFFKVDEQGRKFFFITGRLKELIIRGGVNISPLEIDELLSGIEGIKIAIAVGFENDWYGEEVGALVQLHSGSTLTKEDILNRCAEKMQFQKCPKVVVFTSDIPVTSTGKYQRSKVKPLFAEWKSVQFKPEKELPQ
jgi:acyl-CoA synthetase (AMP-forming)/AMP-acid ligase II